MPSGPSSRVGLALSTWESGQRPRLDATLKALEQGQKLVAKAVVMEAAVRLVNEAGFFTASSNSAAHETIAFLSAP